MDGAASSPPLKTYELIKNSTFNYRRLELRHDGRPFVWINTKVGFFQSPVINFHTDSEAGAIIAAAKLTAFTGGVDVVVGNPSGTPEDQWAQVVRDGLGTSSFTFAAHGDGHLYQWRRTHRKELGSSRLSNSDYKLVDPSNGDKILAVYVKDSFTGGPRVAHIDFMVEFGAELELQVIASILGIEERLRRSRNNSSAAGAGASVT